MRPRWQRAVLGWLLGLGGLIAVGAGLGVAAHGAQSIDKSAVIAVVRWRTPGLTAAAHVLSWFGRSWVAASLAAVVDLLEARRGRRGAVALRSVLGAVVVQHVVKLLVMRPRPDVAHLEHVTSSSFPSGHATEATALAAGVILVVWAATEARGGRVAAVACGVALACAVGLSRVYLGVHYPSDVVGGMLLGAGCAIVSRQSGNRRTPMRASPAMTTISATAQRPSVARQMLNKVPEVTVYFWVIKCLCTTVGETFSDDLVGSWSGGGSVAAQNTALLEVTFVTAGVLAITLAIQFTRKRYIAWIYWLNVVLISVFGTQLTDNFEGNGVVPNNMIAITIVSASLVAIVFAAWWYVERTLSMHSIRTHRREAFYWLAVCATFAMGTAVGDLLAEKLSLGYLDTLLVFVGVILVIAAVWRFTKVNGVLIFWLAYIMTRPLGASTGDLLAQRGNQGLALGVHVTSYIFLGLIAAFVAFLQIRKPDLTPAARANADAINHPHLPHLHSDASVAGGPSSQEA